ncbi:hypothetical protein BJV74DRAFT_36882 [Russula compacta]|nr:hypothetical protein BJV74DRAFT_36882 [Russula compacta]
MSSTSSHPSSTFTDSPTSSSTSGSGKVRFEFDDEVGGTCGTYRRTPKLCEVWTRDEPGGNQWDWESIRPLSADVDRAPSGQVRSRTVFSHRPWSLHSNLFGHRPAPPPPPPQEYQLDGAGASADALGPISGLRTSFIIAMPHADAANWRRSEMSQLSRVEGWGRREYAIGTYHPPFREGGHALKPCIVPPTSDMVV